MSEVKTDAQWWWDHYHKLEVERDELRRKLEIEELKEWRANHPSWEFALKDMTIQRDEALSKLAAAEALMRDNVSGASKLWEFQQQRDAAVALASRLAEALGALIHWWDFVVTRSTTEVSLWPQARAALAELKAQRK